MHKIEDKLSEVRCRIQKAAINCGRDPNQITLLAVSKKKGLEAINEAYHANQRHFGENYASEALEKQRQITFDDMVWHFIGPVQSNKTRSIAEHFAWVHSIDRIKIIERLAEQRPPALPPLNLCIQVNIDNELSKSGANIDDIERLAESILRFDSLRLRGLMAIPNPAKQNSDIDSAFKRMHLLFKQLQANPKFADIDTLSMGMTNDLEHAIAHGSTLVRIGRAIFGDRR